MVLLTRCPAIVCRRCKRNPRLRCWQTFLAAQIDVNRNPPLSAFALRRGQSPADAATRGGSVDQHPDAEPRSQSHGAPPADNCPLGRPHRARHEAGLFVLCLLVELFLRASMLLNRLWDCRGGGGGVYFCCLC